MTETAAALSKKETNPAIIALLLQVKNCCLNNTYLTRTASLLTVSVSFLGEK